MIREYKVNQRNSTVCGYPGRTFDWSKFDWDGNEERDERKSPMAWVEEGWLFLGEHYVYMHVPYDFAEQGTIYRVRANDCMYPGERYRGHIVKELRAVKKEDGWYWQLEFEE